MSLDRIDRKILSALQDDNKITNLELAERIGISPPACLRRVKALRNQKIIEGDISLINPTALGKQITVVIEIVVARAGANVVDKVKRKMLTTPEVSQCYLVTGDTDFIVIAQLKEADGDKHDAARILGISYRTLQRRVKQFDLEGYPRYR